MTNITWESMEKSRIEGEARKAALLQGFAEAEQLYQEEIKTYGPNCAAERREIRLSTAYRNYYNAIEAHLWGLNPPSPIIPELPTETDRQKAERKQQAELERRQALEKYNSPEEVAKRDAEDRRKLDEYWAWRDQIAYFGHTCDNDMGGCSICERISERIAQRRIDRLNGKY